MGKYVSHNIGKQYEYKNSRTYWASKQGILPEMIKVSNIRKLWIPLDYNSSNPITSKTKTKTIKVKGIRDKTKSIVRDFNKSFARVNK